MKNRLFGLACLFAATCSHADWSYTGRLDEMTGKRMQIAEIESVNSLALDFPYQGKNHATLQVRNHPRYGLATIFYVDKGQLICSRYKGCNLLVRFDDQPPVTFSGGESADHDAKIIFIQNSKKFIAEAKKAKRILISVGFFHNGDQTLTFTSAVPLVWPPALP